MEILVLSGLLQSPGLSIGFQAPTPTAHVTFSASTSRCGYRGTVARVAPVGTLGT